MPLACVGASLGSWGNAALAFPIVPGGGTGASFLRQGGTTVVALLLAFGRTPEGMAGDTAGDFAFVCNGDTSFPFSDFTFSRKTSSNGSGPDGLVFFSRSRSAFVIPGLIMSPFTSPKNSLLTPMPRLIHAGLLLSPARRVSASDVPCPSSAPLTPDTLVFGAMWL